jgi:type IV pilus assembly protein PilA
MAEDTHAQTTFPVRPLGGSPVPAGTAEGADDASAERGSTFVELVVVLLVLAILMAVAIPTFLGVQGGAQSRAAQTNLMNALISAKSVYGTSSSYPAGIVTSLGNQEPELRFTTGTVPTNGLSNFVSAAVTTGGGGELILVTYSPGSTGGGTCFSVASWDGSGSAMTNGPTAGGTWYAGWKEADTSSCTASTIPASATWTTAFPASWTS